MISTNDFASLVLSFESMSNKKLQKICYYIYCWYLVIFKEKLSDTEFEAWVHGPVSRRIYNNYKGYGWDDIPKYIGFLPVDNDTISFCKKVYLHYNQYSANELEIMTHKEEPWRNARKGCKSYQSSNNLISNDDIKQFYSSNRELINRFTN